MSRRYKPSASRHQNMLLPMRIEDYIHQDNQIRAIDAYVDTLDMKELGFNHSRHLS